jgi:hypothetical protein
MRSWVKSQRAATRVDQKRREENREFRLICVQPKDRCALSKSLRGKVIITVCTRGTTSTYERSSEGLFTSNKMPTGEN